MATLITGCGGFIGHFLLEHLSQSGVTKLHSIGRHPIPSKTSTHHLCDMTDQAALDATIQKIQPTTVYHLAGLAKVSSTIGIPEYFKANTLPTHCLMQALSTLNHSIKVFYSSSVHVYGNQKNKVDETCTLHPETEYGFSKYLAECTIKSFVDNHPKLTAVIARLYTCIGPTQPEGFAASDFCKKIIALKDSKEKVLKVGPVKASRQFIDVRDAVTVFPKLMQQNFSRRFEVFNLSSTETHSVEEILNTLVKISKQKVKIESQENNNNQLVDLSVSTEKLSKIIPSTHFRPMEETLRDMMLALS